MNPLAFALALLLYSLRWKRRIIQIHLGLFKWKKSDLGSGFRFRWYLCLSRDLIDSLRGKTLPVQLRPQDRSKLDVLLTQRSLFLTGHFHNWEALAGWMARQGIPLLGAARPLSSPGFHGLLSFLRKRHGVPVVTQNILPRALAHLRAGHCFGVLWDQYSPLHRHSSLFLGVSAAMDPLPEILIRRHRPAVMAGFLLPDGTLRLVPLQSACSGLPDPSRLSRRFHRVLEVVIRTYPTYWYGLCHARFKDRVDYPGHRKVSRETSSAINPDTSETSRETSSGTYLHPSQVSR